MSVQFFFSDQGDKSICPIQTNVVVDKGECVNDKNPKAIQLQLI